MSSRWRIAIGTAISALALALILKDTDLRRMARAVSQANYWWLLPNCACAMLAMWVRAVRWRILLLGRVPTLDAFHIANAGNLLNNILPFRLGELARAYLAGRQSEAGGIRCLSSVLVERMLDVLTVFGFLLLTLPFTGRHETLMRTTTITAVITMVGLLALVVMAAMRGRVMQLAHRSCSWIAPSCRQALLHRVDGFLEGVQRLGIVPLTKGCLLSVLVWICWCSSCWLLLLGFLPDAPWYMGMFVTCAVAMGLALPSAPSGTGLYEAAVVAALRLFGVQVDVALAYGIVLHFSSFAFIAVLGVLGLLRTGESLKGLTASAQALLAEVRGR